MGISHYDIMGTDRTITYWSVNPRQFTRLARESAETAHNLIPFHYKKKSMAYFAVMSDTPGNFVPDIGPIIYV